MKKSRFGQIMAKIWYFIWEDNSALSWIVNIILAFLLIKFIVYPGLGLALGTSHPVVAVVSGSMEHDGSLEQWWNTQSEWYIQHNITKTGFDEYAFKNGFNMGDIIVLKGSNNIDIGDVIVFSSPYKKEPIIHRVVNKYDNHFDTKGDHNTGQGKYDMKVSQQQMIGAALFKIPYLGWVKIGFVKLLHAIGIGG